VGGYYSGRRPEPNGIHPRARLPIHDLQSSFRPHQTSAAPAGPAPRAPVRARAGWLGGLHHWDQHRRPSELRRAGVRQRHDDFFRLIFRTAVSTMHSSSRTRDALQLLTVEHVAERLHVSTKSVRRYIDRGELPVHRLGGLIRISEADLQQFLEARRSVG
jgi:excisionase family DNA binding protein